MPKHDPLDTLRQDPQAAALLQDKASLAQLLQSPEAQTLAGLLQQMGERDLRAAAQSAAAGDSSALRGLLASVTSDPLGAKALETINRKAGS